PRITPRATRPASAQSSPSGLHPIPQLQRTLGNRRVAQLIQARRLTPEGKIIGLQRKLTVSAATLGHDITFGASRFAPGTQEGQRLIAHELTHVVQRSRVDENRVGQSNERRGLSSISTLTLQRDTTTAAPRTSVVPQIKGTTSAKLSNKEAVHQLVLKLFAEDGLFSTLHRIVANFRDDMKT